MAGLEKGNSYSLKVTGFNSAGSTVGTYSLSTVNTGELDMDFG